MDFVSSMLPLVGGSAGLVALFFLWKKSSAVRAGWPESRRKAFERALIGAAVALSCYLLYAFREMAYGVGGVLIFALGVAIPALLFRRVGEAADRSEPGVVPEVAAADLSRLIRKVRVPTLIEWGGVPVPVSAEPQHFAVLDASGKGRLAALSAILASIRARGDTAFVVDADGALLSRHFDPDVDFIFNPSDARSIELDGAPGSEERFSAADMVRAEHSGVLFLTYRASERDALREPFAELLEDAGRAVLELEPDAARRVWFLVDDVAALERMPVLDALLTRARVKGACVVLGMASLDAMEELYGAQGTRNLLEQVGGWLVMGCADEHTAQYASERLDALARADALPAPNVALERLASLAVLQGLLRLPGGYPLARVSLVAPPPGAQPAFAPRSDVRPEARAPRAAPAPTPAATEGLNPVQTPRAAPSRPATPMSGALPAQAPAAMPTPSAVRAQPPASAPTPAARPAPVEPAVVVSAEPQQRASRETPPTRIVPGLDGNTPPTGVREARLPEAHRIDVRNERPAREPAPAKVSGEAPARAGTAARNASAQALEALVRAAKGRASLAERLEGQGLRSPSGEPSAVPSGPRPGPAVASRVATKPNPMLDGLLRTSAGSKAPAREVPLRGEEQVAVESVVPSVEPARPVSSSIESSPPDSSNSASSSPPALAPVPVTVLATSEASGSSEARPAEPAEAPVYTAEPQAPAPARSDRKPSAQDPRQGGRGRPAGGPRPREAAKSAAKSGEPMGGKARDMLQGLLK